MFQFLRKFSDVFLFSSLFIALCAVVMAYHTFKLFHYPVNTSLIWFIFWGTLCSYNFHWFLTPVPQSLSHKASWTGKHRPFHAALTCLGLVGASYYGFLLLPFWPCLLLTAFLTFLYSAPKVPLAPFRVLKKVAIGKTVFLALAWTHIPFMLPLLVSTKDWSNAEYLFVFNRFFLIYAICIVFDYRDREADRKEGIRSLITQLPEAGINRLFWSSLAVFGASAIRLLYEGFGLFTFWLLLLPGLILAFSYTYSKRQTSDYYYYFVLDGLMMLSSLMLLIF